jgi:diguanylate cyclase (GGDEF)-like protein
MPSRLSVSTSPSSLVERLTAAIDRWVPFLPLHLQPSFRADFEEFGAEHDRTLQTLEHIWERRDRRLSLDESTGLARRRPFLDHLASVLAAPRPVPAVAVLFLDVDNLKKLNDTFGHEAGDRALAAVGRTIRDAIRVERDVDFLTRLDAESDDYSVARHGGDEFLVALELTDPAGIDVVAPRIKHRVDDPERQRACGHIAPAPITVSMGGVVFEPHTAASAPLAPNVLARGLIAAADEQMYESKRDGRIHIAPARFTDRLEIDREHARTIG